MNHIPQPSKRSTLIVSLLLIMLITAVSVSAAPQTEPAAAPVPDKPAREASAPSAQLAIEDFSPAETLGVQTINLNKFSGGAATISATGVNFVRMPIRWSALAPTDIDPAAYDWTALDNAMDLAVSEGYEILAEIDHNPAWAASWERGPVNCVPLTRFTDFVTAVVQRYSVAPYNVRYWEVYNEPDSSSGTAATPTCTGSTDEVAFGDHPGDYVTHLQAAYNAIKAVNANNVVVLGGLAYDMFTTESGVFVESFFDDILTLGAEAYFDVANFHYYPHLKDRWETQTGLPGVRAKTAAVQEIMSNNSVDKPIICTEMGMSSGGPLTYWPSETEDSQAVDVIVQFTQSIAAGNKISIWFTMVDYGNSDFYAEFGLLDYPGYAPKLAVDALSTLASALPNFSYARPLGATEMGATDMEGYLFWDQSGGEALYILWSADGSDQTITLPSGVTAVVDKFGDPVAYSSTLDIDEQPVLITSSVAFQHLYLPLTPR